MQRSPRVQIVMSASTRSTANQERQYLLRRHNIDYTDLFAATLALWQQRTEGDPLERLAQVERLFEKFLDEKLSYELMQKVTRLIDKAMGSIQKDLADIIDPYISEIFQDQPIKLRLVNILETDVVVEVKLDEGSDESRPSISHCASDG